MTDPLKTFAVFHLAAFLIGSIPFGYLFARIKGKDIRSEGSGNTGATNVGRVLGKKFGILTLLADAGKGAASVYLVMLLPETKLASFYHNELAASLGFFAILGHCYSPFLKGKGGKGVATSLGVFLALLPYETLIACAVFIVVLLVWRFVSLASLIGTISVPIAYAILSKGTQSGFILFVCIFTALLIFMRHRENIERLVSGTETKTNLFSREKLRS